jgi:uncharacterized membrane-anchored protein
VFLGRRTKDLVPRLAVGSIAVLDHADLDGVAARSLALRRPCAIVNNQPTITGRYANRGPLVLIEAGIPVFDLGSQAPGNDGSGAPVDLFAQLRDGERVTIEDGARLLRADGSLVTAVRPLSRERLEACWEAARANLDAELSAFAENTLRFLQRPEERALLLGPVAVPPVRTRIGGRPVLVVVRGDRFEDDLQQLGRYVREQRPVVIAVDGAADTLLALGVRPNIILGDMDSVADGSLRCGAELVVHAYAAPRADAGETAPGLVRLRALGLAEHAHTFPVPGTSEDAALLLAFEKGADLIVAVGTHTNLEDFLDKGRRGMASTFLVRLKVGSRLVDARGVSRLYRTGEPLAPLLVFLLLAGLFPVVVLLASTTPGQVAWRSIVLWFRVLFR